MLDTLHFGKKNIQRIVKFDDSCYYPLVIDNDWNISRLFGLSHGHYTQNSVNLGWRPSEKRLDSIDLFSIVYKNGLRNVDYFYSISTNEYYATRIKINSDSPVVSFSVFDIESGEKIANFLHHYKTPLIPFGQILGHKSESIIHTNVSPEIVKSKFRYGKS